MMVVPRVNPASVYGRKPMMNRVMIPTRMASVTWMRKTIKPVRVESLDSASQADRRSAEGQVELVGQHGARQDGFLLRTDDGDGEQDGAQQQHEQVRPPQAGVDESLGQCDGHEDAGGEPGQRAGDENQYGTQQETEKSLEEESPRTGDRGQHHADPGHHHRGKQNPEEQQRLGIQHVARSQDGAGEHGEDEKFDGRVSPVSQVFEELGASIRRGWDQPAALAPAACQRRRWFGFREIGQEDDLGISAGSSEGSSGMREFEKLLIVAGS